jgi:hypothetical protein
MPTLLQSLQDQDLGQLHIIADLWGIELKAPDARQGRKNLVKSILKTDLIAEVIESLPEEAQTALGTLLDNDSRFPWPQFVRRFGEVREMGPGRRDREKPHLNPASTAEALWYRALVWRAFFDTPSGPQEYAYIPEDLAKLMPPLSAMSNITLSRPATSEEIKVKYAANDHILDHACTLLAALRLGFAKEQIREISEDWGIPPNVLTSLLKAANLLDEQGQPNPENTRGHLEADRGAALLALVNAWLNSPDHNDLRLHPHLQVEGEWGNDPLQTRHKLLELLGQLDSETWWSLPALVSSIKEHFPDYQRSEYDSWYLKDTRTEEYLRGFENWDKVEGELLRYLITGPLHWLGLVDLAAPDKEASPLAFRFSRWSVALFANQPASPVNEENEKITADSKLTLHIPALARRAVRYLLARFCAWDGLRKGGYRYHITPASLAKAQEQGLQANQLVALLRRHTATKLPPNLIQALERWEQEGAQARLESVLVLRVKQPEILQALRSSRAARFLGDPLGPTSVVVKPGAWNNVVGALAEMGYLADIEE